MNDIRSEKLKKGSCLNESVSDVGTMRDSID